MTKPIIIKEQAINRLIKRIMDENTIPAAGPPIDAKRKRINEDDDEEENVKNKPKIHPYRGSLEARPKNKSLKTTRFEKSVFAADDDEGTRITRDDSESYFNRIADAMASGEDVAVGADDEGEPLRVKMSDVPKNLRIAPGASSSVRLELEKAIDKLRLSGDELRKHGGGVGSIIPKTEGSFELVKQMVSVALNGYKEILKKPLNILKAAAKDYIADLVETGVLDDKEINELKSESGLIHIIGSEAFEEFLFGDTYEKRADRGSKGLGNGWLVNYAPPDVQKTWAAKSAFMTQQLHTLIDLAKNVGTLDLANTEPSEIDTDLTKVDRALIYDDGFRYYMGGLGGEKTYYWDYVRNAAESIGKYSGQF